MIIPALSFRLSRVVLLAIVLVNLIVIIGITDYLWNFSLIDYGDLTNSNINNLQNGFSNYLEGDILDFDRLGVQIQPNDVKFKFVNPKRKSGTPEKILERNSKFYSTFFESSINEPKDMDIETIRPPAPESIGDYVHANATIIALVRNIEAVKIGKLIKKFDKVFNKKFKYPYTFINDVPFTDGFKQKMESYTDAPLEFITIPHHLWDKPSFIDTAKEREAMNEFQAKDIAYAKKASYHNMCRFYLGTFYDLPELQKYRYYWRLEPNVDFYNDINYDVFKYLQTTGKIYGFTVNLYDIDETVKTLWPETLNYLNQDDNYKYVHQNGSFQWLLENQQNPQKNDNTGGYSTCHFWSNFEIGDMEFFRSEAYSRWFKYLDQAGGFYYERWGDAPVHSMGLALFADKSKIHWFRDIGYFHDPYLNCPNLGTKLRCTPGLFSRWKHLQDQNCMASWIDYSMDEQVY